MSAIASAAAVWAVLSSAPAEAPAASGATATILAALPDAQGSTPDGAGDRAPRREARVAERREERRRGWYLSGFLLEESEARLPTFPYKILSATAPLRKAYAADLTVDRVIIPRFAIPLPFFKLRGNSLDLEGAFLQHFGHERDSEIAAAAVLRFGQFGLFGRTSMNLAWGNGLSYALTSPTYELGREGVRGVDTVHLQYHMSFEVEMTSGAAPHLHYVLRLHHRSGIYGVISPSRTGSNYLGLGLRFDLARHGS